MIVEGEVSSDMLDDDMLPIPDVAEPLHLLGDVVELANPLSGFNHCLLLDTRFDERL